MAKRFILTCLTSTLIVAASMLPGSASAAFIGIGDFAGDTFESFEGIGAPLPAPNLGVNGFRGPIPAAGFTTGSGLAITGSSVKYITDWSFGLANIASTGVSIFSATDVIDGTAYFYVHSAGRVVIELPTVATRFGAHMGGNGVQNTTFEMYLGNTLVDSFTTSGLTSFTNFTGWQSAALFDRVEWNGQHSGFDLFAFDGLTQVPEPTTLTLFGVGLVGLGFASRRRRPKLKVV